MVSDPNTPIPNKLFFTVMIASIIVIVAIVMLYLSSRQASFAKTLPYSVEVKLNVKDGQKLIAAYDYGYGFNAGHQQVFELIPNQSQTINFTVSAWKQLKSLRIHSDHAVAVDSLLIGNNAVDYQALESTTLVSPESPLELNEITQKLLRVKD